MTRVTGLAPSEFVLAWRRGDERPLLRLLMTAAERAVRGVGEPAYVQMTRFGGLEVMDLVDPPNPVRGAGKVLWR